LERRFWAGDLKSEKEVPKEHAMERQRFRPRGVLERQKTRGKETQGGLKRYIPDEGVSVLPRGRNRTGHGACGKDGI